MKKQFLTLVYFALFASAITAFANPKKESTINTKKLQTPSIAFTENKGQVHDKNYQACPEVLYGISIGNMAVHIKDNGLSYQLYRVDKWKGSEDPKTKQKLKEVEKQTVYRIDLKWINANLNFTKSEDEALPGYNNYYLAACPNGVLNVKSYKGIRLNNLYDGINLHYYQKNGELKHDYIVAPHANYKQIQVMLEGADVYLKEDGSLILTTPLGDVQEGAPLVFQKGKQLKAKWLINDKTLSFDVENYDANEELIIDPVTRLWGTYYGGNGDEFGISCATDHSNNVFLSGYTNTSSGTLIATSGSHQMTFGGFGNYDAYLVKFNSSGVRQWGTYYGGTGNDYNQCCTTDSNGDSYLCGYTFSYGMGTSGSFQPSLTVSSGSNANDAFLVKFNSNGVRLWATYYGDIGEDRGYSCSTDAANNVYMAGYTTSSNGTTIATPASHQPTVSSITAAFLVKFNPYGTRLWATFYAGIGFEGAWSCATDPSNNVYMVGYTDSNTLIATSGSHQSTFGGGTGTPYDAFLVKFNSNGVRQWSTYYGGTGTEYCYACCTDQLGNVFISGNTTSSVGVVIASPGSHQPTYGGSWDAFLVKFNSNGVRQWGTYFGSAASEYCSICTTDGLNNVYISGITPLNTGTTIATIGSHQTNFGGVEDAYLAKFNSNGIRQWGTYYGDNVDERGWSCAADYAGNVYLAGVTEANTGTVIATIGSHQPTFGGASIDAFIVKFDACDFAPSQPASISPTFACVGTTSTFSASLGYGTNSYTWALPNGWTGSSNLNTLSATPGVSGIFTITSSNACGVSPQQTMNIVVNPSPTVTVNSGSICSGQLFTIVPNGANTYTFSGGNIVSPNSTTNYTITGANTLGCFNAAVSTVTVVSSPVILVSNTAICIGQSFTIMPQGANSYTFSNGPIVTPSISSTYTVTGTGAAACSGSALVSVNVNLLPVIILASSNPIVCVDETAILTAYGATNYTFNPGGIGNNISISPSVTTNYTVTGIDSRGCINIAVMTQSVDACTGITLLDNTNKATVHVYPNPSNGIIQIDLDSDYEITILNGIGQLLYNSIGKAGLNQIDLINYPKGIYFVKFNNVNKSSTTKILID